MDTLQSPRVPNTLILDQARNVPLAIIDDDDVQFVFSAPLPTKKRKRVEGSQSMIEVKQEISPSEKSTVKPSPEPPEQLPRRGSEAMLQQLKSCRIGTDEEKPGYNRSESLPTVSITAIPNSGTQPSQSQGPSDLGFTPVDVSLLPNVDLTYDSSPEFDAEFIARGWRPVLFGSHSAKKRKHDGENKEACLHSDIAPQPPAVSPKTLYPPAPSPLHSPSELFGYLDMLGNSSMQDMFGLAALDNLVGTSSQDFICSSSTDISPKENLLQANTTSNKPVGTGANNTTIPPMEMSSSQNLNINPTASNKFSRPLRTGLLSNTAHPSYTSANHGNSRISAPSFSSLQLEIQSSQPDSLLRRHTPIVTPTNPSTPHVIPNSNPPAYVWHAPPAIQTRDACRTMPTETHIRPSDILRKPSLYSVPQWMPTSKVDSPGNHVPANPGTSIPSNHPSVYHDANHSLPSQARTHTSSQLQNTSVGAGDQARKDAPFEVARSLNPSTHFWRRPQPESIDTQTRRERGRNEYSPNLIVDIAETCRENFPFAAVAQRHNKSIQKVFDTFSAIIQLPLLRNAEDKRRHGSLGKRRLREYRDAKKAMEKAHEAERKAQLNTMSANEEYGARKKPKPSPQQPHLLRTAILNNAARESQYFSS